MTTPATPVRSNTALTFGLILAITGWRVACLGFNRVDLYVDEAQYWLWGQELAFGYFSKPPLIGWIIRLSNEIGGSDSAFWVRLPGPLLYGAAAITLSCLARHWWPRNAANWAGVVFATLPGVAVLSLFMSTDAALLLLFALALLALVALSRAPSPAWALVLGAAIGLGLMAKYAMIYFVALSAVAVALRLVRLAPRDLWLAAIVALAIIAPNLWWNLDNGFITFAHTAGNAGWAGIAWNWAGLAEFIATQIVAMGPVFGVAFVVLLVRRDVPGGGAVLLLFSLPIFLAVAAQALIRDANGNWAAPAFLAAVALAGPWVFLRARRVFWLGLAFNAVIAVALPVAPAFPDRLEVNGRLVFDRAMGMRAAAETVLDRAARENLPYVMASDRGLLAALVYASKGRDIRVLSLPAIAPDIANSHYQLTRPATIETLPALLVSFDTIPPDCAQNARIVEDLRPTTGGLKGHSLKLAIVTSPCFAN